MMHSLVWFVAVSSSLLMHPVHETVCEVQWNAESRRVEVALRVDVLDEQWMEKHSSDEVDWRIATLRKNLLFDPVVAKESTGRTTGRPLHWVGHKQEGGHVWWFFEVVCDDGEPPTELRSTLLFDRHPDYRHQILVLGDAKTDSGKRQAIVLTDQRPNATLRLR